MGTEQARGLSADSGNDFADLEQKQKIFWEKGKVKKERDRRRNHINEGIRGYIVHRRSKTRNEMGRRN